MLESKEIRGYRYLEMLRPYYPDIIGKELDDSVRLALPAETWTGLFQEADRWLQKIVTGYVGGVSYRREVGDCDEYADAAATIIRLIWWRWVLVDPDRFAGAGYPPAINSVRATRWDDRGGNHAHCVFLLLDPAGDERLMGYEPQTLRSWEMRTYHRIYRLK